LPIKLEFWTVKAEDSVISTDITSPAEPVVDVLFVTVRLRNVTLLALEIYPEAALLPLLQWKKEF
jgi:hypothetical protein